MRFSTVGRKNFVIFSLVIMLGLIGYINYNLNKQSLLQTSSELEEYRMTMLENDTKIIDFTNDENEDEHLSILDSREGKQATEKVKATSAEIRENITNQQMLKSSAYFIESRLERDKKRSEMVSHLNDIIDNQFTNENVREEALGIKMDIISNTDKEGAIETMIAAKGFDDVIVYLNDNSINVIVDAQTLQEEDIAKIVDIIRRETNISLDGITIKNKK